MGRKRKKGDEWMPPGVYAEPWANRYVIRSKLTNNKKRRLCGYPLPRSKVWEAYEAYQGNTNGTINGLAKQYFGSQQFTRLAPRTQSDYRNYHERLQDITFNKGQKFMDANPAQVTKGVIRQILDLRASQGAPIQGNRQIKGFLSAVFRYGIESEKILGMKDNPCHVRRNEESGSNHYVEDWEIRYAIERARPWYLPIVIELAYLLYARISEVLDLRLADLTPEGVLMRRKKSSSDNIVRWGPRLEAAVNQALGHKQEIGSLYLLHDKHGQKLRYEAVRHAWDRCMAKCQADAAAEGLEFRPYNRHAMKYKGVTDTEQDNPAGHKSEAMRIKYRLKPKQVDPAR